jgi:HD superfamily phosphodiesterase
MPEYLPLPPEVFAICRSVHAPPRLVAHLTLVHDVAAKLVKGIHEAFPELEFDGSAVLFGAATHDIGKCLFPEELSGPGSHHESDGAEILDEILQQLAADADERLAWQAEFPVTSE